jgi:hypothetical protein
MMEYVGMFFIGACFGLVAASPILLFALLFAWWKYRERKRIRKEILERNPNLTRDYTCIPVRHATAGRFKIFWKLFPWESMGLLCLRPGEAIYFATVAAWKDLTLHFTKDNCRVGWMGTKFWRNGLLSWVELARDGENHYFSSETGTLIFGSKDTTKELHGHITRALDQPAA